MRNLIMIVINFKVEREHFINDNHEPVFSARWQKDNIGAKYQE